LIQSSSINLVALCVGLFACLVTPGSQAGQLDDSQAVVSKINQEAASTQQNIDRLAAESQTLMEEYQRLQNGLEYQTAFTRELEQLNESQQLRIENLKKQIQQAAVTQQRIVPLMRSMADSLQKFVALDLPFHHQQRLNAVQLLQQRIRQPDLSISMKFRLLLETWQLEQDYGMTIEAWRGPLQLPDETLSVEFLRIGRVALYYQGLDGLQSGYWDQAAQGWQQLDSTYNTNINKAMRVARKQLAPQLLNLPVTSPGGQP
jgi:hypothetical protein